MFNDREKAGFEQYVGNAITMFMKGRDAYKFVDALPGEVFIVDNPIGAWEVAVNNMPESLPNFEN